MQHLTNALFAMKHSENSKNYFSIIYLECNGNDAFKIRKKWLEMNAVFNSLYFEQRNKIMRFILHICNDKSIRRDVMVDKNVLTSIFGLVFFVGVFLRILVCIGLIRGNHFWYNPLI